jgi:chemotaxis protein methyltransferase CheR
MQHRHLSDTEFSKLSNFIYNEVGIKMPPAKKTLLESRLQKRLTALQISTFKDYLELVFSQKGMKSELINMIDVVTTNKTDFFREPMHFDFLNSTVFPEIAAEGKSKIMIWSAGCSSGEEPYTLTMVCNEFREKHDAFDFAVTASDISTIVLEKAVTGIYDEQRVQDIPMSLKRKYFLKSKDPLKKNYRVVPEMRQKVNFQRLNFMDNSYENFPVQDIIFCRNVLIYFDRKTQEQVIGRLCSRLKSGGYLFIGHSESLTDMQLPLTQVRPTIFRRR